MDRKITSDTIIDSGVFLDYAKTLVTEYAKEHLDKSDPDYNDGFDVFIVWYAKELKNHKALVSTTLRDGMYYEITYNGLTSEIYFDAYKKFDNKCVYISD